MAQRVMLTMADREEISRGLAEGLEQKEIAARIGRDPSVVSREISRHGGKSGYRATRADVRAGARRARPKRRRLDVRAQLREVVAGKLASGCSPDQVAGRLRYEYPGQHDWQVSHEAIYGWIYALPKGELARLGVFLRSGRTQRRSRGRAQASGARSWGCARSMSARTRPPAGGCPATGRGFGDR